MGRNDQGGQVGGVPAPNQEKRGRGIREDGSYETSEGGASGGPSRTRWKEPPSAIVFSVQVKATGELVTIVDKRYEGQQQVLVADDGREFRPLAHSIGVEEIV